jgi:hypothetical protein
MVRVCGRLYLYLFDLIRERESKKREKRADHPRVTGAAQKSIHELDFAIHAFSWKHVDGFFREINGLCQFTGLSMRSTCVFPLGTLIRR